MVLFVGADTRSFPQKIAIKTYHLGSISVTNVQLLILVVAPASDDPRAKVKLIVLLTLIPINSAASLSTDTARIALPILVFLTIN